MFALELCAHDAKRRSTDARVRAAGKLQRLCLASHSCTCSVGVTPRPCAACRPQGACGKQRVLVSILHMPLVSAKFRPRVRPSIGQSRPHSSAWCVGHARSSPPEAISQAMSRLASNGPCGRDQSCCSILGYLFAPPASRSEIIVFHICLAIGREAILNRTRPAQANTRRGPNAFRCSRELPRSGWRPPPAHAFPVRPCSQAKCEGHPQAPVALRKHYRRHMVQGQEAPPNTAGARKLGAAKVQSLTGSQYCTDLGRLWQSEPLPSTPGRFREHGLWRGPRHAPGLPMAPESFRACKLEEVLCASLPRNRRRGPKKKQTSLPSRP